MALFNAYFDASGKKDMDGRKRAMYVAGFVSTVEKWRKFEVAWPALLARHEIPEPFQMSKFMARKNPQVPGIFKDWRGDELAFLLDAARLVKRYTNKPFAAGVTMENLTRMFDEYEVRTDEPREPFPWCGLHVCHSVLLWQIRQQQRGRRVELAIVFEDGDDDKGVLKAAARSWFKLDLAFKMNDGKMFAPLAAADFLAWELRTWSEHRERGWETLEMGDAAPTVEERARLTTSGLKGLLPRPFVPHLMEHLPKDGLEYGTWESLVRYCDLAGFPHRKKP